MLHPVTLSLTHSLCRGGSSEAAAAMLHPVKHANVLVVHRKEGIEVLHLHTGVCVFVCVCVCSC